ncbi:hypothetical protein N9928_01820, partial [bacterium]|nr:hypothetical protein [bacterium]
VYNKFMDEADKIKKENKNIEIKQIPNKNQMAELLRKEVLGLYGEDEHQLKRNYINGFKDAYRCILYFNE